MSKIGLLIQRTLNGLTTEYSSDTAYNALSSTLFLTDERIMAIQLSPNKSIVSIAQDTQYKCYSLIKGTLDREQRNGFYAIRLFVKAGEELINIKNHLLRISQVYENALANNLQYDYSQLFEQIQQDVKDSPYVLGENIKKGIYYLAQVNDLDSVFLDKRIAFVEKFYIFFDSIASNYIQDFHLKSLSEITIKEIFFHDPVGHIQAVYINEKKVNPKNLNKQGGTTLIMLTTDKLFYQDREGKKEYSSSELTTRKVIIQGYMEYIKALYINNKEQPKQVRTLTMLSEDKFDLQSIYDKEPRLFTQETISIKRLRVDNKGGQIEALWVEDRPIRIKEYVYALQQEHFYYKLKGEQQRRTVPDGEDLVSPRKQEQNKVQGTYTPNWLLLGLVALGGLLLGAIGGWFFTNMNAQENLTMEKENLRKKVIDSLDKIQKHEQTREEQTEGNLPTEQKVEETSQANQQNKK
jgi:hypothetical protein